MTRTTRRSALGRDGFTTVELIIVTMIGAVMILSIYGVLVNQQRSYTIQGAQIAAQQSARAGMEILATEFRSLSGLGGDVIAMDDDTVSLRVMRKFGIACGVSLTPPAVTVRKVGAWFDVNDSIHVYADGDEDVALDDVWLSGTASSVDTTRTCGTYPAQLISVGGVGGAFTVDTVRVGAPVRSYERVSFGLGTYQGEPYLGRWGTATSFIPLVGPLDASSGPALRLDYFDINGNVTATPTDVHRIDVMVRSESDVALPSGHPVSDSLVVSVFARN